MFCDIRSFFRRLSPSEFFVRRRLLRLAARKNPEVGSVRRRNRLHPDGVADCALLRRGTALHRVGVLFSAWLLTCFTHLFINWFIKPHKVVTWQCDSKNIKSHKYVCITTDQPDTKSNPDPNPNSNPNTKKAHNIVTSHVCRKINTGHRFHYFVLSFYLS